MKWGLIWMLVITAALSATGCKSRQGKLAKIWFYTHDSDLPVSLTAADDISATPHLTPACFLNLESNGTYTLYFSHFEYGIWKLEGEHIKLINQQQHTTELLLYAFKDNELVLQFPEELQLSGKHYFEGTNNQFEEELDNPFCKQNNEWRLKATHKENDKEIAARLRNHFRFWEKYFTWAINTERNSLDVRSTPTLLKLYGNGFVLKPFDELPFGWVSNFYDKEDCNRASDKVSNFFQSDDITWPQTESKYKLFVSAFQQLQEKVR